jgi:large subunit ribosomal protein L4
VTSVDVLSPEGEKGGTVELPDHVFDVTANVPLMHQVVVAQQAAARQGTHDTKTRGEVRGGGKKPYRQKGTGRARQGSIRAPQFVGGGISHGPVPRGYAQRTPKKMKAAALRGALSDRARAGKVHVLSAVVEGSTPSTKSAAATLAALQAGRNVLVVVTREDSAGWKSLRNLPEVHLLACDQLNTYDVLVSDDVVFTRAALDEFLSAVGAEAAAEAEAPKKAAAKKAAPKKAAAKAEAAEAEDSAASDDSNEEEAK